MKRLVLLALLASLMTVVWGQIQVYPPNAGTGGGSPTGTAGGDLSGSYPNPGVAKVNGSSVPASANVLGSNSSSQLIAQTVINGVTQVSADPATCTLGTTADIFNTATGLRKYCSATNVWTVGSSVSGNLVVGNTVYCGTPVSTALTNYSLSAANNGCTIIFTSGSNVSVTIPAGLGSGFSAQLIQLGAGTVTPIASGTTFTTSAATNGVGNTISVWSPSSDTYLMSLSSTIPKFNVNNTWTAEQMFSLSALATTPLDVISVVNPTLATSVATVQVSPGLNQIGHAYNTTSTLDNVIISRWYMVPATGTSTSGSEQLCFSINGGAFTCPFYVSSSGTIGFTTANQTTNLLTQTQWRLGKGLVIEWGPNTNYGSDDTGISRDAPGVIDFGNGAAKDVSATLQFYGHIGPATAPSGACTVNGVWVFSQDGHATVCLALTWVSKI